jgi:hypothetical protein
MSEQTGHLTSRPWTVTTFEVLAVAIGLLEVIASDFNLLLVLLAVLYLWLTLSITRKKSLGATGLFTALTILNVALILGLAIVTMLEATSLEIGLRHFDWTSFIAVPLSVFQLWLLWNPLTKKWLATER